MSSLNESLYCVPTPSGYSDEEDEVKREALDIWGSDEADGKPAGSYATFTEPSGSRPAYSGFHRAVGFRSEMQPKSWLANAESLSGGDIGEGEVPKRE